MSLSGTVSLAERRARPRTLAFLLSLVEFPLSCKHYVELPLSTLERRADVKERRTRMVTRRTFPRSSAARAR